MADGGGVTKAEIVTACAFESVASFIENDMSSPSYVIFHPLFHWKKTKLENYYVKPLLTQLFKNGECVYEDKSVDEIRSYCAKEVESLWDEVKRFENPHTYYVDLSQDLWDLKINLLDNFGNNN